MYQREFSAVARVLRDLAGVMILLRCVLQRYVHVPLSICPGEPVMPGDVSNDIVWLEMGSIVALTVESFA